jgi:hypothetical protein
MNIVGLLIWRNPIVISIPAIVWNVMMITNATGNAGGTAASIVLTMKIVPKVRCAVRIQI